MCLNPRYQGYPSHFVQVCHEVEYYELSRKLNENEQNWTERRRFPGGPLNLAMSKDGRQKQTLDFTSTFSRACSMSRATNLLTVVFACLLGWLVDCGQLCPLLTPGGS